LWKRSNGAALVRLQLALEFHGVPRLGHPVEGLALHAQGDPPVREHAAHPLAVAGIGQIGAVLKGRAESKEAEEGCCRVPEG
jgi:hypothetical protein